MSLNLARDLGIGGVGSTTHQSNLVDEVQVEIQNWDSVSHQVCALRKVQWALHSPWLLELYPDGEDPFDQYSDHALLIEDGQLMSSVRLTPSTSELQACHGQFKKFLTENQNYAEIGRLITTGNRVERVRQSYTLLLEAGKIYYERGQHKGLVGICRSEKLRFFKRFGFVPAFAEATYLASRKNVYWLIYSDWNSMIEKTRANELLEVLK